MTKKETAILRSMYDEAMADYMVYVMKRENAPMDILERACVMTDVYKALVKTDDDEVGGLAPSPLMQPRLF